MNYYDLPTSVEIGDVEYPIRSDYRVALDCIQIMGDAELADDERTLLLFEVFYEDWEAIDPDFWQEALDRVFWFIGGGKEKSRAKKPKLMDWEQDFPLIAAPVNRVLGFEIRDVAYLHWWSFLAAYNEIGDCLFAQVVSIRKKRLKGKLDKSDRAFAKENAELVNFKVKATLAEESIVEEWT